MEAHHDPRHPRVQHGGVTMISGFAGISLAGQWECGGCGATGDGWYDEDDGLVLHDDNGQPDEHDCGEA